MKARKERWSNERKAATARLPVYEHILEMFPNSAAAAMKVGEVRKAAKGE